MPTSPSPFPPAVHEALVTLGANLNAARRRRRLPMFMLAQLARTTRQTIGRMQNGDPGIAIGTWAAVLFAVGLGDKLSDLAAPPNDLYGRFLETHQLPQRLRVRGKAGRR